MREIFYDVIKEASCGAVFIDGEEWPIAFNTIIYDKGNVKSSLFNDKNLSTLVISSSDELFKYLAIYIDKELSMNRKCVPFVRDNLNNKIKMLISYLFVNASVSDFNDFVGYLKRRIQFLDDNTFTDEINISLGDLFKSKVDGDVVLNIKNCQEDVRMEAPYRLDFSLVRNNDKFYLPSISYGICEEYGEKYCYIYSILNHKHDVSDEYCKKVSRMLYKINEHSFDDDLKDVSMSAVLSLTIFLNLLKIKGISHAKGVLYLPVRYLSRDLMANDNEEKVIRNDNIQSNLTDKFLRTFRRVSYHLNGVDVLNEDLTVDDGYVEVSLDSKEYLANNSFLNDVTKSIYHYR